jgi:hypothetical protein
VFVAPVSFGLFADLGFAGSGARFRRPKIRRRSTDDAEGGEGRISKLLREPEPPLRLQPQELGSAVRAYERVTGWVTTDAQ